MGTVWIFFKEPLEIRNIDTITIIKDLGDAMIGVYKKLLADPN